MRYVLCMVQLAVSHTSIDFIVIAAKGGYCLYGTVAANGPIVHWYMNKYEAAVYW
jgi:hypothetical protein